MSGLATRSPMPWLASVTFAVVACRGGETPSDAVALVTIDEPAPRVIVLGVAQDAGVPQLGCHETRCRAAARDPAQARYVASIAIQDADDHLYIVDATPDLGRQLRWRHREPGWPRAATPSRYELHSSGKGVST